MMNAMASVSAGALIGLSVAAPVGPMGLLCIKRTLTQGMLVGISTGAGATTVNVGYCALLLLGLDRVSPFLADHRTLLSLLGGALMLIFAWRLARSRRRLPSERHATAGSAVIAYITAVGFNMTNLMSMVLLTASLASFFGPAMPRGPEGWLLLLGLGAGSVGWWIGLVAVTATLHRRLSGGALAALNKLAAAALAAFGVMAVARVMLA